MAKLLNTFFSIRNKGNHKILTILGIKVKLKFDKQKHLEKKILKKLYHLAKDRGCDSVYLYKHHIGEIYVYLNLLPHFIKKNKSYKPLIIVNEERYRPLYDICLKNTYILANYNISSNSMDSISQNYIKYKNIKIYNPTPNRFFELRRDLLSGKKRHFYDYIKKELNVQVNISYFYKFKSRKQDSISLKEKLEHIDFASNKYVVLLTEAVTAMGLPKDFWQDIINNLVKKGYSVFDNTYSGYTIYKNCKSCYLSLGELYALVEKSEGVISLISGATVFLASLGVKIDTIYTSQTPSDNQMTATQMLDGYTLHKIPFQKTDYINEYNADKETLPQIKNKILRHY